MSSNYLSNDMQKKLRNMNLISENEVVQQIGDLFVAVNILTQARRNIELDTKLLGEVDNRSRRVLRG